MRPSEVPRPGYPFLGQPSRERVSSFRRVPLLRRELRHLPLRFSGRYPRNLPQRPHVVRILPSRGGSSTQSRGSHRLHLVGLASLSGPSRLRCATIASRFLATPALNSGVRAPAGDRYRNRPPSRKSFTRRSARSVNKLSTIISHPPPRDRQSLPIQPLLLQDLRHLCHQRHRPPGFHRFAPPRTNLHRSRMCFWSVVPR